MDIAIKTNRSLNEIRSRQVDIFHKALNDMRKRDIDTDVSIVCGTREFRAHKLIITASSSYFRRMLNSEFKESKTNRIEMLTVSDWMMEIILDFLYLASPNNFSFSNMDDLMQVFKAAHLLDIETLSSFCWAKIKSQITTHNYLDIWNLTRLYGTDKDVEDIVKFLSEDIEEVLKNDLFLQVNYSQLEFMIRAVRRTSRVEQFTLLEGIIKWVKHDEKERQKYLHKLFGYLDVGTLTLVYLSNLMHYESIFYSDIGVLNRVITYFLHPPYVLPGDIPVTVGDSIHLYELNTFLQINFFGYFYKLSEVTKTYNKIGALQAVNIHKQTKQNPTFLSFPLTSGMACVRKDFLFYFIGGESLASTDTSGPLAKMLCLNESVRFLPRNPTSTFLCYDITKDIVVFKPSLVYPVSYAQICIANSNTIYVVGGIFRANNEVPIVIQYYKEAIDHWGIIELPDVELDVLSCQNLYGLMFLICVTSMNTYCLYFVSEDNLCTFQAQVPFSYHLRSNLITTYENQLCFFIFEEGTSLCILYNSRTRKWRSMYIPFQLKDSANMIQLYPCRQNKRILFFLNYKKSFLFSPITSKFTFILPEIVLDLGYRERLLVGDEYEEHHTQNHELMVI